MDDAWFHTLTTNTTQTTREKPSHRRRQSLLQQPVSQTISQREAQHLIRKQAEEKADVTTEVIPESNEDENAWCGPPQATIARRAQSYHDFYHVARSHLGKDRRLLRRTSLDGFRPRAAENEDIQLAFDRECIGLEKEHLEESHARYQTYQEQLELSSSHLDNLLSSTRASLDTLGHLSKSFEAVETQTNAFRQQCESLVSEQKRLESLADAIGENVQYYMYLEPMTRRLNAPGAANLVKGDDFPEMLSNLDNCLAYMESHPKHKDSATYRSRYRLLLTRALTLIRHYFTKVLGDIAADISKRIQGGQLKETTHSALLYAKFRVPAPELKSLGVQIQKRAVPTPDDVDAGREPEYMSLLRELYQSYAATRGRLVLPLVTRKMAELATANQQADVLAFAKASLGFVRGICLDEYDLWFEWFETEGALYDFLENLMEPVFDHMRPRTIHETKLEKLCELCATIQGRYMDLDSDEDDSDDDGESAVASPVANGKPSGRKLDFGSLVHPALEDAQTRLVFLALNTLRDTIENYKPKSEELDWPKQEVAPSVNGVKQGPVLSGKRDNAKSPNPQTPIGGENDDLANAETPSNHSNWYPTLPKAIWLLRRIYRLVNSTVFDDLAHRIVHSTTASLLFASQQISGKSSPADGQLFLITHLLHLKQQIVAFDIEFIPPEVEFDFSSVTNTFYELRDRGSLWNPASWVRLVGGAVGGGLLPKVVENMLDAKAELDGRLRTVINEFVNGYAAHITAPISPATIEQASKTTTNKDTSSFDPLKAVRTVRGLAEKDVPALRAKLLSFVDDARTRETLVAAVRDQVVLTYEEFFDAQSEGQMKKLSRKGKGREDEVWGPELFGEAMERVFAVGQGVEEGGGEEGV